MVFEYNYRQRDENTTGSAGQLAGREGKKVIFRNPRGEGNKCNRSVTQTAFLLLTHHGKSPGKILDKNKNWLFNYSVK